MNKKVKEIMLIDDDTPTNYLSKLIIDNKKCCENLSIYFSAEVALGHLNDRINQNQTLPDIIFLDLNMPRLNGWEFLKHFESFDFNSNKDKPNVYILTTSMNSEDRNRADNIDCASGFYKKPLTENTIDEVFYQLLSDNKSSLAS